MARYSAFLGRRVEVQYRASDILLPASGTFVADSGRSIFLEQILELRGQHKHFRWEIPYQCIIRIEEKPDTEIKPAAGVPSVQPCKPGEENVAQPTQQTEPLNAKSATASAGGPSILPMANRPKTA